MAKAKKLPSGQWRTLVYDYTDSNGKRHYESFTADTKKESEYLAAEFSLNKNKKKRNKVANITFKEAREEYIEYKKSTLSPSTLRGYKQMNTYYRELDDIALAKLDQDKIQEWADRFSKTHSPKTVKNAHGLISAVLKKYNVSIELNTELPKKKKLTYYVPAESEVVKLIEFLKQEDKEMLKAVLLSAFGTLRRSEICGLYSKDIKGNVIHVNSARVLDMDNNYIDKGTTKNESSDRYVTFPQFVIDTLPGDGKIVSLEPNVITERHKRYLKRLGIHHFRFHDLRHYSASIMHAIGIPDQYIMARGGWSSDAVLKQIYRGTMDDYEKIFTEKTNEHFENMCNMDATRKENAT